MKTPQFRITLKPDSFVRNLDGVGFIYNISTHRQEVFDASGAVFLKQIGRSYRTGEETVDSLNRIFVGAPREVLLSDFREFAAHLHQAEFVEILGDEDQLAVAPPGKARNADSIPATDRGPAETSEFLKEHFRAHPTVFSFQFYTTEQCNEHCIHCYVDRKPYGRSLPLERRLALIDELVTLGTLDVTFTGGEALLCKDLPVLMERARKNDLVVAVLSNLTLLTDEFVEALAKPNVDVVQMSIYSMDAEVHETITRHPGSLKQTRLGLERLRSAGVRVRISCPVLKENRSSFHDVFRYGADLGVPVNCDFAIMAMEDGDTSNLAHRIGTGDLEAVVRQVVQGSPKYRERLEQNRDALDATSLDTCGIGTYMLCMKSNGEFLPCPGFGLVVGNAWDSDIEKVWKESPQLAALRRFSRRNSFPQCSSCDANAFCHFCLAKFQNETGWASGVVPSGYCEVARINKRVAREYLAIGR